MEYCSAWRKKDIFPFAITWMGLENIMLNQVTQIEKTKTV